MIIIGGASLISTIHHLQWTKALTNVRCIIIIGKGGSSVDYYSSFAMDEVKKLRERVKRLQKQRADELEGRLLLSSCPTWKNSFGRFPYAEKSE